MKQPARVYEVDEPTVALFRGADWLSVGIDLTHCVPSRKPLITNTFLLTQRLGAVKLVGQSMRYPTQFGRYRYLIGWRQSLSRTSRRILSPSGVAPRQLDLDRANAAHHNSLAQTAQIRFFALP